MNEHPYVCIYVCMYVCMYVCVYVYVCVCTYMYVRIYVCMCMDGFGKQGMHVEFLKGIVLENVHLTLDKQTV
jgi:hypothetical protein